MVDIFEAVESYENRYILKCVIFKCAYFDLSMWVYTYLKTFCRLESLANFRELHCLRI